MSRSPDALKKDECAAAAPGEGSGASDRSFRYAVIVYALVEFFAIALLLYYKLAR